MIERVRALTRRIVRTVDLKDFGRCEFRVTPVLPAEAGKQPRYEGPLPRPRRAAHPRARGRHLHRRAPERRRVRRGDPRHRQERVPAPRPLALEQTPPENRKTSLRVGLTFNMKRTDTAADDAEAEFDSPKTIAAITAAIESYGHTVVSLEATSCRARSPTPCRRGLQHRRRRARPRARGPGAGGVRAARRPLQRQRRHHALHLPGQGHPQADHLRSARSTPPSGR